MISRLGVLLAVTAMCLSTALRADDPKAGPAPLAAKFVIDKACVEAKATKKNVFLHYTASWCGWCKRLEKVLETEPFKSEFKKQFVMIHLDVMENGDKKSLENPGGNELLAKHGGDKGGIPFIVILNPKAEKLTDSNGLPGNKNIGCPATEEEIAVFDKMLAKTAPGMTEAFRKQLADHFRELNKKQQ